VFNLVIGTGTRQAGSALNFSDIDWAKTPLFLKIQIYNQGAWKYLGTSRLWSVPYAMVTNDIGAPLKKLAVTGETDNLEEALFEVKNKDGQIIFAVYNEGVRVYVSDGDEKGVKGGFAIGGFGTTKVSSQPYFIVRPDSIRMYLYDTVKAVKGGFAIGGYGITKDRSQDYLFVSSDSIRAYIDNSSAKGPKGGFAIGGFGTVKDKAGHYFNVSTDTSNIINPSQNRILWYPLKNAFLAGRVLVEKPDSVGINSFATGYESKAKGQYSQAMGYKAISRGNYSTSIGYQSVANKDNSFAFGQWAMAKNFESYAFGRGAIAEGYRSFAFGSSGVDSLGKTTEVAYAKGDYSFAIGQGSISSGFGSYAIGLQDTASAGFALALGYGCNSSGWYSTSMGFMNQASGWTSTAMGRLTIASGGTSTAIGSETVASGGSSFAGGDGSKATSWSTFAFGHYNLASEANAVAMGQFTKATGENSFAMGQFSEANGKNSTALGGGLANGSVSIASGQGTVASGSCSFVGGLESKATHNFSFSFGLRSTASGYKSVAFGWETIAKSCAVLVLGRFNDTTNMTNRDWYVSTDPAFEIGNGTSNSDRKNAFTVLQNSNVGINMVSPQQKLDIAGGNGRVEAGYSWLTDSDIRFKKNIVTIENSLEKVMAMRGVNFDLISCNTANERKSIGFIAQELETVVPEVVVTGSDGYKSVAYDKITAVLTEAIKEQQKQIEIQQKEIDDLKALVKDLIAEKE
ncbi:MAG: tail fiber domain-containing protein, partial [Bacteroidia bacterium]|nr:tail fiber domain-containing protein [Bacteroidia bacterium]